MPRPALRHLRRCRLLFVLALCAWLGLAGSVFAQSVDCCGGMAGMSGAMHHDGAPAPLHADGGHADCACVHAPALVVLAGLPHGSPSLLTVDGPATTPSAPELPHAPPLRPPLA